MIDARLDDIVARVPDRTAVVQGGRRLSFRELGDAVKGLRSGLHGLGVGVGDRVLIALPNCPEFVIGYFATAGLGAEVQALDPDLKDHEILDRTRDHAPTVVVTEVAMTGRIFALSTRWGATPRLITVDEPPAGAHHFATLAATCERPAAVPRPADDAWVITHSSGTTGEPKRVRRSQRNQLAEAHHIISTARITAEDVVLCPVPLFHALGQFCCMIVSVFAGATLVLVEPGEETPESAAAGLVVLLGEHRVTVLTAVPYVLEALADWPADRPADLSSVRLCLSGSNFLNPAVGERFTARFGVPVRQTYGSSEAGSVAWDCDPGHVVPGSVGRPLDGVTVEILDEGGEPLPQGATGEIAVRSASVTTDGTDVLPDGRHLTGDLGFRTPDGRLWVTGRKRVLIDTGGQKVNPVEVEAVLEEHPDVLEAAVFGVPLDGAGDLLAAAVVARGTPDARALAAHCEARLVGHKVPRKFTLVSELPRTRLGKVRRAALAALAGEEMAPVPGGAEGIWTEPDSDVRIRRIAEHVLRCAAEITGADPETTGADAVLSDLRLDSLGALRLKMTLQDTLRRTVGLPELLGQKTVESLAETLALREPWVPLTAARSTVGEFPLSANQMSLRHADQADGAAENLAFAARIVGGCRPEALLSAFQSLVDRHPVLRTTFGIRDGESFQRVAAHARVDFLIDPTPYDEPALDEELAAQALRPFDLRREFPLRVRLYTGLPGGDHALLMNTHHIVSDFWSLVVVLRDLETAYAAAADGQEIYRPVPTHTYTDYVRWHAETVAGPVGDRDWEHWREVFATLPPALELPIDKPRPPVQRREGATYYHDLGAERLKGLEALAHDRGTTVYTVLLTVFHVLLHGLTGERDLAVAAITTNRQRHEFHDVLGYFGNPVVCRTSILPDEPFDELLERVRSVLLAAIEHQELPFEQVMTRLGVKRDRGRSPLVEVAFGQNKSHHDDRLEVSSFLSGGSGRVLRLATLTLESLDLRRHSVVYDLSGAVYEALDSVAIAWEFNTDLFEKDSVVQMAEQFAHLLDAVLLEPGSAVGGLDISTPAQQALLDTALDNGLVRAGIATVPESTARFARADPDRTAVESDGRRLSRRQLHDGARELAVRLRALGLPAGATVLLWLPHSADLVVAGLGTLEAGAVCDPLSVGSDPARVRAEAERTDVHALVTTAAGRARLGATDTPVLCVDEPGDPGPEPEPPAPPLGAPALVQRTSGVTDPPRAAVMDHGTLAAWSAWLGDRYGDLDGVLVHGALCADRALARALAVVAAGGTAVLTANGATPTSLAELLTDGRDFALVTLTPSECAAVLPALRERSPRSAALALTGERFDGGLLRELRAAAGRIRVVHEYGGAATAPVVSAHEVPPEAVYTTGPVPAGLPVPGVHHRVLDDTGRRCPPGVAGEIHVAVGTGAFGPTGDVGRVLPDGGLVVLGRATDRMAHRGYRFDPAAAEEALAGLPHVARALVSGDPAGPCAYVTEAAGAPGPRPSAAALLATLRRMMPPYMVPATCVWVDGLPMAGNGKTARHTAPVGGQPGTGATVLPQAPEPSPSEAADGPALTPLEARIAAIWTEFLPVSEVAPDDDYFDLDGDSISGMRIVARAADVGITITVRQLFTYPVLRELAAVAKVADDAEAVDDTGTRAPDRATTTGPGVPPSIPLAPVQRWFFDLDLAEPDRWNQTLLLRTTQRVDRGALATALRVVAAHHPVFRYRFDVAPDGPRQIHDPDGEPVHIVEEARYRRPEEIAAELVDTTDLRHGPVLTAGILPTDADDGTAQVVLSAHHLVVDFVSWQVVIDDLTTAYRQLVGAQTVRLPDSLPYEQWTRLLYERAGSRELRAELDHWAPKDTPAAPAPPTARMPERDARVVTAELSAPETARLLERAGRTTGSRVQDLVLAAVVGAVGEWTGEHTVRVDLERHGRDGLFDGVDPGRTVGWFTVLHPVRFDLPDEPEPAAVHAAVRHALNGVPGDGLGYGLLRHAAPDPEIRRRMAALPPSLVNFTYLGRLGELLDFDGSPASAERLFAPSPLTGVADRAPGNGRPCPLEISAMLTGGRLRVRVVHSAGDDRARPAAGLAADVVAAVRPLIDLLPAGG
ncbi:AMP-binding protein [Streptomyces sp. NPDC050610]|uniref:AMP-binding protein n=1 Tax=Streptomyces sp. NPDC050610 TaxID=3157097 RepID=UPI00341B3039